jgi:hypothetical protein
MAAAFVVAGGVALGSGARAEEEERSIQDQVREQMQKIARLMRENEKALLTLSTGADASAKPVDVEVPEDASPEAAPPPTSPPPQGDDPSEKGRAAAQAMEELLRKRETSATSIPRELEELVRMIPT